MHRSIAWDLGKPAAEIDTKGPSTATRRAPASIATCRSPPMARLTARRRSTMSSPGRSAPRLVVLRSTGCGTWSWHAPGATAGTRSPTCADASAGTRRGPCRRSPVTLGGTRGTHPDLLNPSVGRWPRWMPRESSSATAYRRSSRRPAVSPPRACSFRPSAAASLPESGLRCNGLVSGATSVGSPSAAQPWLTRQQPVENAPSPVDR